MRVFVFLLYLYRNRIIHIIITFSRTLVKVSEIFYICAIMESELKRLLRREASAHHMCEENRTALEAIESKADAVALYKKTIDWALEENFPSLPALRRFFSDCEDLGIYVDKIFHGEELKDHQVYVFHNCKGQIRTGINLEKSIIPMLYFANNCEMAVKSAGNFGQIRVPLYIFGENSISAEDTEDISFKFYHFDTK